MAGFGCPPREQAQNGISRAFRASLDDHTPQLREKLQENLEFVVSQTFVSWNQIAAWLRRLEGLRGAA